MKIMRLQERIFLQVGDLVGNKGTVANAAAAGKNAAKYILERIEN